MLTCMQNHASSSAEGETIMINDNSLLSKEANEKWRKTGNYANDAGGIITKIKKVVDSLNFEIRFELITKHKSKKFDFNIDPLKNLMKKCDEEARRVLSGIKTRTEHSNLETFGNLTISTNNEVMERPIREAIGTTCATTNELNHVIEKHPQHYEMIDLEERNSFPNGLSNSAIK